MAGGLDDARQQSDIGAVGNPRTAIKIGLRVVILMALAAIALLAAVFVQHGFGLKSVASLINRDDRGFIAKQRIDLPNAEDLPMELLDLSPDDAQARNALVPFVAGPNPPAAPYHFIGDEAARQRALSCLTAAQYYEAGSDWVGQRAVAQVVLNRVRHPAYPSTVCGVVFEGSERRTGCQFTFTCDGALARKPVPALWQQTETIAAQALDGVVFPAVGYATHYHTDWVVPAWSSRLDKLARVQTHLFFRWRGDWGKPAAFHAAQSPNEPFEDKLAAIAVAHISTAAEDGFTPLAETAPVAETAVAPVPVNSQVALTSEAFRARGINLRGAALKLVHPEGDAFGFQLPRTLPGSFGLLALDVCQGRAFCKVMGWTNPAAIPDSFPISQTSQSSMDFLYIYDRIARREILGWNCAIFPRHDPAECLSREMTRWDAVNDAPPKL